MSITKVNGNTPSKLFGVSNLAKWNGIAVDFGSTSISGDFKTIFGTVVISSGSTTATITEGTDYTLETGVGSGSAFIYVTNTRRTGMGRTSGGATVNLDDFTAHITNGGNLATSVTFERAGTTGDTRIDYEIVQYVGDADGPNEIKVRDRDVISLGTSDTTKLTSAKNYSTTNILEPYKCMPIITSQSTDSTGSSDWGTGLHFLNFEWSSTSYQIQANRGDSGVLSDLSYVLVEFTGANWGPVRQKAYSLSQTSTWTPSGADGYDDFVITDTVNDVSICQGLQDVTKTLLHPQWRITDTIAGLDDAGKQVLLKDTDEIRVRSRETGSGKYYKLYLVEHIGTGTGAMAVQNLSIADDTLNTGTLERQWTESINDVTDETNAMIFGETASVDGAGTAYPRGSINLRLAGSSQLTLTECDDGQERRIGAQIVQMPYCSSAAPSTPTSFDEVSAYYARTSYQSVSNLESNLAYRKYEFTSVNDVQWIKLTIPTIESYSNLSNIMPEIVRLENSMYVDIEVYSGNMAKIWSDTQVLLGSSITSTRFLSATSSTYDSNLLASDDQVFWVKITPYSSSDLNNPFLCYWGMYGSLLNVTYINSSSTSVTTYDPNCLSFYRAYWTVLHVPISNFRSFSVYHNYDGTTYAGRDYVLHDLSNYSSGVATPDSSYTTTSGQGRTIVLSKGSFFNPLGAGTWLIGTSVNAGNTGQVDGRIQYYWD